MTTGQRIRTFCGAKPGLLTNLLVGACLLVATLGARTVVPDELPSLSNIQNGTAADIDCVGDKVSEFHMQPGLTDCPWILFERACAGCCPEGLASDYPTVPLKKSLSGKTLELLGRRIAQLDCGNGHSLSVQFYACLGFPISHWLAQ